MINLIVAYAHHRVIGKENQIPWHLPNDLKYFQKVTTGHTIVMGRKTFQSIGRPLPNRRNVVLTRQKDFHPTGVEVIHSKQEVLGLSGDLFIIGGAEVYTQFLDEADRLYITEVDLTVDGDTFFPEWNCQDFQLFSQTEGQLDAKNQIRHMFSIYERKKGNDFSM